MKIIFASAAYKQKELLNKSSSIWRIAISWLKVYRPCIATIANRSYAIACTIPEINVVRYIRSHDIGNTTYDFMARVFINQRRCSYYRTGNGYVVLPGDRNIAPAGKSIVARIAQSAPVIDACQRSLSGIYQLSIRVGDG